jgi:hypothetical protein
MMAGRHGSKEFSPSCKTNGRSIILLSWKWALHLLHRIQSGWAEGGASAEGAAAVVGCVDGAVGAGEGGDADGAGDETGVGEGGNGGKCDIKSDVVMVYGESCTVLCHKTL